MAGRYTFQPPQAHLHDWSIPTAPTRRSPVIRPSDELPLINVTLPTPMTPTSQGLLPRKKWRDRLEHAVLNLSPAFFSLNMGTGIASILLHNLPYNGSWLRGIAIGIFILNVILFAVFSLASIARYTRWRGIFTAMSRHTMAGMYWGCLPMGLATIIVSPPASRHSCADEQNMIAFVCVPRWGGSWARLALGLWWIDVLLSVLTNFGMIFMMCVEATQRGEDVLTPRFTRQQHSLETISAALLLPIVSTVVAAASGGIVSQALMPFDPHLARSTVITSYAVWGTGVPVALFLITLWIYRTAVAGLPPPAALPSVFLPLGPCGQGAFGAMILGSVVRDLAYVHDISLTVAPSAALITGAAPIADSMYRIADGVYAAGLVTGFTLWGLGLVWYTIAMAITLDHAIRNKVYMSHTSFTIGWTAYTFPIGVWATATTQLAKELDSPAFRILGTVVSLQVVLQWLYVFVLACGKAWQGTIFVAPELNEWEGKKPPLRFGGRGKWYST